MRRQKTSLCRIKMPDFVPVCALTLCSIAPSFAQAAPNATKAGQPSPAQPSAVQPASGLRANGAGGAATSDTAVPARIVKVDDFETGIINWAPFLYNVGSFGPDSGARVGITDKAAQVKSGKGSLYYIHNVAPKSVSLLALERRLDLTGMQSIRFQLKCDAPTIMGFAAREQNGARYEAFFYCPANKWQDIALDLHDLTPAADAKDDNDHLDLNNLAGIYLADASGMFIEAFAGQDGARIMWLDDVEYSSKRVAPQNVALATPSADAPIMIDNFEAGTIRWIPLLLQLQPALKIDLADGDLQLDRQAASGNGAKSLKATYKREAATAPVWLHSLENTKLRGAQTLDLALRTAADGVFLVSIKEKDESRYEQVVEIKREDGWKKFSWPLTSFKLADDAKDENGKLDIQSAEEISIADLTAVLPPALGKGPFGDTALWIDEVQFGRVDTNTSPAGATTTDTK